MEALYNLARMVTFNSTRYIRNYPLGGLFSNRRSSFNSTRYIRNRSFRRTVYSFLRLSTPHGTLGTLLKNISLVGLCLLSTPHGTLGTGGEDEPTHHDLPPFNSTRYIRNLLRENSYSCDSSNFQLHTVH